MDKWKAGDRVRCITPSLECYGKVGTVTYVYTAIKGFEDVGVSFDDGTKIWTTTASLEKEAQ